MPLLPPLLRSLPSRWPEAPNATAEAAMDLLKELKLAGYRVVFMKPKFPVTTLPEHDEMIMKQLKVSGGDERPTSSVVRTISE